MVSSGTSTSSPLSSSLASSAIGQFCEGFLARKTRWKNTSSHCFLLCFLRCLLGGLNQSKFFRFVDGSWPCNELATITNLEPESQTKQRIRVSKFMDCFRKVPIIVASQKSPKSKRLPRRNQKIHIATST